MTTAERLNSLRKELNIDKKKFTSGANGKKYKKYKVKTGDKRPRVIKYRKLIKFYCEEYVEHLLSIPEEDALDELERCERTFKSKTEQEKLDEDWYYYKKEQKALKLEEKYLSRKKVKSLKDLRKYESKFKRDKKKIVKKLRRSGFDVYNDNITPRFDPKDLIKRLEKQRKASDDLNERFIKEMNSRYSEGNKPSIIENADKMAKRIKKSQDQLLKSLNTITRG